MFAGEHFSQTSFVVKFGILLLEVLENQVVIFVRDILIGPKETAWQSLIAMLDDRNFAILRII